MKLREMKITSRGTGTGDRNWYELVTSDKPTREEIRKAQAKLGFPPDGYDGPNEVTSKCYMIPRGETNVVAYITTWWSSSCCD